MRLTGLLGVALLAAGCAGGLRNGGVGVHESAGASGPRVLAVIAHPDDETVFAGTLYKAATHLGAVCDLVVITNGEGGLKYATLAERIYGLELTVEEIGRRHLPAIRRKEMLASAQLLGARDVHFLDQRDHRYTRDLDEVLGPFAGVWDLELVVGFLTDLMQEGKYDFLLTLVPTSQAHAHHQAASLLAVASAAALRPQDRPVVLAAQTVEDVGQAPPVTIHRDGAGLRSGRAFVFDRRQPFGYRDRLDYRVLVNWVIAAHRSQGTKQLEVNGNPLERFYLYTANAPDAEARAHALFESLRGPQFIPRIYGESAGIDG